MLKNFAKILAVMAFAVLTTSPAPAQLHIQLPIPHLEVRVGHTAPPRLRVERRPQRPDRYHTWVGGSWDWQGNDWVWIDGRWDRPESRGVRWVQARYVREGRGWRHEPGHWSNQRLVEGEDYRRWRAENRDDRREDRRDRRDRRERERERDYRGD